MTEQYIKRIIETELLYIDETILVTLRLGLIDKYQYAKFIRNNYRLWNNAWEPILDELGCDVSPWHPDNVSMRIVERVIELIKEEQNNDY